MYDRYNITIAIKLKNKIHIFGRKHSALNYCKSNCIKRMFEFRILENRRRKKML